MKTITKISDTQFEVTETKEVTTSKFVNLDQLENEKLQLLTNLNQQVTSIKTRVSEIDEQIIALKADGGKTFVEAENERQAQQKAEQDAKLAEEELKANNE